MKKKQVLFLLPYPLRLAPSQRFRVEQFFPSLDRTGIRFRTASFLDAKAYQRLYTRGNHLFKLFSVLKGFALRMGILFSLHKFDFIFIHREASPLGPPLFEWLIAVVFRKKIIYDFDDAIWIPDGAGPFMRMLKCSWKIKWICRWSHRISAGNPFLVTYASVYNRNVLLLPTTVDMVNRYNRCVEQSPGRVVIGWTGSHSTLRYLEPVWDLLEALTKRYDAEFLVISDRPPEKSFESLRFLRWREEAEIDDLLRMHIGIMPLEQDAWSEGKCGFKIIQYLSLCIPAVASPVGVNGKIISHGVDGMLAGSPGEFEKALEALIENYELRSMMGRNGRKKMAGLYSVQANEESFLSLFD